jgi:hypothetical protein
MILPDKEEQELVEKCIEIVRQEGRASTSLLQRRLRLGYTRASRIMEILTDRGIVAPGEGAAPRKVLIADAGEIAADPMGDPRCPDCGGDVQKCGIDTYKCRKCGEGWTMEALS